MNKTELQEAVHLELTGKGSLLSKADVASVIDTTTAAIIDALKKEKSVIIRGFGTFEVMKAAARIARNPRTGESISVPEKTKMKFRAVSGILE